MCSIAAFVAGIAVTGILMSACAAPVMAVVTVIAMVATGLGLAGVLASAGGSYTGTGIFLGAGAIGAAIGAYVHNAGIEEKNVMIFIVAAILALIIVLVDKIRQGKAETVEEGAGADYQILGNLRIQCAVMLVIVLAMNMHYAALLDYDWQRTPSAMLILGVCAGIGRILGGVLTDRMGGELSSKLSLGGCALASAFSFNMPVFGYLSFMLLNMTLTIALGLLGHLFRENELIAAVLWGVSILLGAVPALYLGCTFLFTAKGLFGLSFLSLVFLLWLVRTDSGK